MKKLLGIVFLGLIINATTAHSMMKYGEFKKLLESNSTDLENYIYGLSSGVRTYETYMKRYDPEGTKFYCAPPKLGLTIENTINIINDEAKRLQKKKPEEDINKELVPFLYIRGIPQTFRFYN